jgi:hypothetical protein
MSEPYESGDALESAECSSFVRSTPPTIPPHRKSRVDWEEVARLIAEGQSTAEIARAVGCSRRHIWRILRKSEKFERALDEAETDTATEASHILAALRPIIAEALSREARSGNVNVLLRLADRLNVFDRPGGAPAGRSAFMTHEERLRELE